MISLSAIGINCTRLLGNISLIFCSNSLYLLATRSWVSVLGLTTTWYRSDWLSPNQNVREVCPAFSPISSNSVGVN